MKERESNFVSYFLQFDLKKKQQEITHRVTVAMHASLSPTLSTPYSPISIPKTLTYSAHLFLSLLPSSLAAGRIIALYGPSSSKRIEHSDETLYCCLSWSIRV
jgi:hypothetical protein